MRTPTIVAVSSLPPAILSVLREVGYRKADIAITPCEATDLLDCGSDGEKAFVSICNLATGEHKTTWGSWGGANIFNRSNPVDLDSNTYQIPPGVGCVVRGHIGGGRPVYASIEVHPATMAPLLPPKVEVTEKEIRILCSLRLKSGPYRKEALSAIDVASEDWTALQSKGMLKRTRNGGTSLTIAGKNAIAGERW